LAAALTALALAGCSASTAHADPPARASSTPSCRAPEAPALPHTAGSLTQSDTGVYCLAAGQILDVFLTTPAGTAAGVRWAQIKTGDNTVLGYGNSGVLTPPINVTPGVFVGVHAGFTTLTSTLPDGTAWHATIVVH
jgi:hypothetical protein